MFESLKNSLSRQRISRTTGVIALSTACFFSEHHKANSAQSTSSAPISPQQALLANSGGSDTVTPGKQLGAVIFTFLGLSITSIAGILTFLSGRQFLRNHEMRRLAREGAETTGEIVSSCDGRGLGLIEGLDWRFTASNGTVHEGGCGLKNLEDYNLYERGQKVQIVYLTKNPKVSSLAISVAVWREQIAKEDSRA